MATIIHNPLGKDLLGNSIDYCDAAQLTAGLEDAKKGYEDEYIFTTLTRRCDSFCKERDACCGASTLVSSWVGPTFIVNLDLFVIPLWSGRFQSSPLACMKRI